MKCCRFLGLDFGEKTIGVAVSLNGRVATGVKTIFRKEPAALRPCLKELKIIIREYSIEQIILGFPKHMHGEESARCAETLTFKEKLERYVKKPVVLWDERLSTCAVLRTFEGKKKRKKNVDTMAAIYILQGYLDYVNGKEDFMEEYNDDSLILETEDGEKIPLTILSSQNDGESIFLLAIAEDDDELVFHFKCLPADDDDEEVILEQIDPEHADYARVFEMFKDEYNELGIDIE